MPIRQKARQPMSAVRLPALDVRPQLGTRHRRWRVGEQKTVYLSALVLGVGALISIICAQQIWAGYIARTPGHPAALGDFLALWSYAKIAVSHPATELYDIAALHQRQVALGVNPSLQKPFPYPPTFIIFLWPISLLPYGVAWVVWIVGTLGLFVWAVVATCSRLPLCVLLILVAPVTGYTIALGQSGFMAAALIIAGLRLANTRPVLAGVLIGILSYKPQLCLLVPIALAAAGFWPALRVACATAVGLGLAATLAFGWQVWPSWLSMIPDYVSNFDRNTAALAIKPTVMANLLMVGVKLPVARCVQAFVALTVAILVWRCFRRNPGRLATAAVLVGTFLATTHAFIYDMPMVSAALALVIQERTDADASFSLGEVLILVLAFLFPALMMLTDFNLPVSSVCLLLFFGLILRRQARQPGDARNDLISQPPGLNMSATGHGPRH